MATTLHTYSDLLHSGDRLAAIVWERTSAQESVAATLRRDPTSIILRVADWQGCYVAIGFAPGGLA